MSATNFDADTAPSRVGLLHWRLPVVAVVLVLLIVAIAARLIGGAFEQRDASARALGWERHTFDVVVETQRYRLGLQAAQAGQRGVVSGGGARELAEYRDGRMQSLASVARLRRMTADNPAQQANVDRLDAANRQRLAELADGLARSAGASGQKRLDILREEADSPGRPLLRTALAAIVDTEKRLLGQRRAAADAYAVAEGKTLWRLSFAGGGLVLAALLAIGAAARNRSQLARETRRRERAEAAERREAELARAGALVTAIGDAMPDLIFAKDRDGRLVYANPATVAFLGSDWATLRGKTTRDYARDPAQAEVIMASDNAIMESGRTAVIDEIFTRIDGTETILLSTKSPLLDARGTVVGLAGITADITQRRQAEAALRDSEARLRKLSDELAVLNAELETRVTERTATLQHALDRLEQENGNRLTAEAQVRQMQKMESIGQLTGGIAHDFNNMLAIVIGSLDLAKRRLTSDPAKAKIGIEHAEEGARRAAQLTARLLAFSRQQPLSPTPVQINRLVGGMSELLQRTLGEGVRIETVLAGGLWTTMIDASELENAIVNLCVNARDAMAGNGRLTIETANAHLDDNYALAHPGIEAGQYVQVAVTDTGSGMVPDVISRAFDPFFTTKGVGSGTGLGLSQVYGFVKQSGGHIKIYSEVGQGTTIKLYLRRHFGDATDRPASRAGQAPPLARAGETVLVVEDDAGVREISAGLLRELGYAVRIAEDGPAALDILAGDADFDLLLTDVVMPGMNGRVLADRAQVLRPGLKLLFTTGYTQNAVVHNGILDPGVALLPKPFTLETLAAKVRAVIDG